VVPPADRRARSQAGRARLVDLALLAASLLLSLAVAEGALRTGRRGLPLWSGFAVHEQLGWTFAPGRADGERLGTNRLGYRDVEHEVAKAPGLRRLLVLGDSFTASTQIRLERSYPRLLQRLLDERAAESWEVISLAVNGWGTAQEWLALRHHGLAFAPDVVLLQFFPNDVCNNAAAAADLCAFHDGMRPYLVEDGGGWRVVWTQPLRRRLRLGSALYRAAERGLAELRMRWRAGTFTRGAEADEALWLRAEQAERLQREFGIAMHPFFYAYAPEAEQIPAVAEGWRATEAMIEAMSAELRAAGIPLALVVMPYDRAVDPAAWQATWSGEPRPPVIPVRDYPEQRLGRLAARLGIPAGLLLPRFEQSRERVLPYRKYHLNREGHRVAAEAIFELLVGEGWVRERAGAQGAPAPGPGPAHSRRAREGPAHSRRAREGPAHSR
jgi:lysophospholipase L1-like esterase